MENFKYIRLIAVFTLIAAQLFACADSSVLPNTDNSESSSKTTETTTAEYIKPNIDYNGETFTIASYTLTYNYPITKYNMISHGEETGDIINDSIISMTRQVEDELNVKLEFFELVNDDRTKTDKITKFIYAGEDAIQAAFPLTAAISSILATPTMLTDLEMITTLDLSHSWWDQNSIAEYNIGGKQYIATGDICFFLKGAPVVTFFNKALFDNLSLDFPYALVYDGNWTIDKLMEMAVLAAHDTNGNNTVDIEEDRFGFICENSTLSYMMFGSAIRYSERDRNGNINISVYNDRSVTFVEKLVPFMTTKNLCINANEYSSQYAEVYEMLLVPSFMENRALFFSNQLLLALDFRKMEADFGILPIPKFDENQEDYFSIMNNYWCDNLIVPVTNARLDMTGHILDAMGYYSQQLVTPAFIETTVLGKSVRDDDSANIIEMIYQNQAYDIAMAFNWGGLFGMVNGLVANKSTNLASTYATNESAIKAAMQKTMDELLAK